MRSYLLKILVRSHCVRPASDAPNGRPAPKVMYKSFVQAASDTPSDLRVFDPPPRHNASDLPQTPRLVNQSNHSLRNYLATLTCFRFHTGNVESLNLVHLASSFIKKTTAQSCTENRGNSQ